MARHFIPIALASNRRIRLQEDAMLENYTSFNEVETAIKNYSNYKPKLDSFFRECCSNNAFASVNIENCIKILESLTDKRDIEYYTNEFVNNILPAAKNLNEVKSSNADLDKVLKEAANDIKLVDRVVNNHNNLAKRYEYENEMADLSKRKNITSDNIVEAVWDIVKEYNMSPGKKMNVALEEVLCVYEMAGLDVDRKAVLENVVDTVLAEYNPISNKDMKTIRTVISTNPFVTESDIKDVSYLLSEDNLKDQAVDDYDDLDVNTKVIHEPEPEEPEYAFTIKGAVIKEAKEAESIDALIKRYKADQNKTEGKMKTILKKIYTKSPNKIIEELPSIIGFVRNFAILSTVTIPYIGPAVAIVTFCVDKFIAMTLKREEADKVLKYFKAEKEKMENKLDKTKDEVKRDRLEEYIKALDESIEKLQDYRDNLYSEAELDRQQEVEEATLINYSDRLTVREYLATKHETVCQWLERAIQLFDSEAIMRLVGVEIDKFECAEGNAADMFKSVNMDTISNFLMTSGLIDVPLYKIKQSVIESYKGNNDIYVQLTDICTAVNKVIRYSGCMIGNYKDNNQYYVTFSYLFPLYLTPDVEPTHESFKEHAANFDFFSEAVDVLEACSASTIVSELHEYEDDIYYNLKDDREYISNLIESAGLITGNDDYSDRSYTQEEALIQLESVIMLREILTEAKKVKENKPKEKINIIQNVKNKFNSGKAAVGTKMADTKQNAKVKANIASSRASEIKNISTAKAGKIAEKTKSGHIAITTNLALAGENIKKSVQKMGTKEKELSRNLDISLSQLKKSIEKALVSDRREAIIKGSIIPSFSKIIKWGIAGGIAFKINPAFAAIGALGALVGSKILTNKERNLLIDEINTELDVVEKEIENAERENDMKEYRRLLTYKKKLNRERQRMEYRMKLFSNANINPEM